MKQEIQSKTLSNAVQSVDAATLKKYLRAANLVGHLNDAETDQFIQISTAFGLNPFKREIYASKYGDNFSIVVGYETYIKRAERSGLLSGWKVTTEGSVNYQRPNESDLKATITIFRKDFKFEFVHEVFFSEYCQRKRSGELTKFWKEKPITMIKKVAISQGFRLCFSDELGGLPYTKEEIGNETIDTEAEIIEEPVKKNVQIETEPLLTTEKQFLKAKELLRNAKNREDVVSVWRGFPDLQSDETFIQVCQNKTKEIEEAKKGDLSDQNNLFDQQDAEEEKSPENEKEAEETPFVEVGSVEEIEEDKPLKDSSTDYDSKDAIFYVRRMNSIQEIMNFTLIESRSSVLKIAKSRIEKLSNNEKNDNNENG